MGTYSHSGIELYIHTVSLLNNSSPIKDSFKMFIYCQYVQAIRFRVDSFILLKPKIFFSKKITLVDWHNHDDRVDDNNQI